MPHRTTLLLVALALAPSVALSCAAPAPPRTASAPPGPRHGRFAGPVAALADKLEASYVLPAVGARYAERLRTQLAQGAYDEIDDREAIASQLSRELQAVAPDGHLRVVTDASPLLRRGDPGRRPGGSPARGGPDPARPPAIGDIAWLADGVAYIQFNEFPGDPETVAAVDRFMADHATARAIIIDARTHHGGGSAEMDAMLPYLYAKETPLVAMEVAERVAGDHGGLSPGGRSMRPVPGPSGLVRQEHFVIPHPTEHRLFAAKVFYLTSSRTFSAAEHLAFAFKRTGRAVLIGERTGGGNHFGAFEPLGDGLFGFVPFGRTLDPVTGADWEGVGVAPDVAVPADHALDEALRRATQRSASPGRPGPDPMAERKDWPEPELRPGLTEPQIAAAIAAYAKQLHDTDHFSGVVLAARAGKVVTARAFGVADVAAKAPITLDTRFDIGSITKLFTKLAIAQLAEAGKLSLDDTIRKHLPGLALAGADQITIRQLVDHRSGLGDTFGPRFLATPPPRLRELADWLPLFVDQPLDFAPGSSERYSNAGYIVLGLIIERITGAPYRDYLARSIFAPANMTRSGSWALDERIADRAIGYTRQGQDGTLPQRIPNTELMSGRPSSAGGTFVTAGDLLRFREALVAGKLASATWTSWMLGGPHDDARPGGVAAYGGGAPGVNAALAVTGAWTVIVLSNFDPPAAEAMSRGAIDIIRGHRPTGLPRHLSGAPEPRGPAPPP